ncbi:MAG TPA: YaaA family protein [Campylobacterales bacterium]|nr:YaaA family protein [Campylobacterales bacterium]HHC11464.1 YaaA family protein [Campylobacterales bacterium]
MKILLAPSETKKSGGDKNFILENLLFPQLTPIRKQLTHKYINILQLGDKKTLSKMFGLKKESDILYYSTKDIVHELTMKAIQRYTGVAFDYIDYNNQDSDTQTYIDNNVILFSNLFGLLRADDKIPEYRLKQGEAIGELRTEKLYKEQSYLLDKYLENEDILDLRATFYNKFYIPNKQYTTLKFIKNGKIISHWAKAYRGIIVKEVAKAKIETIEEFMNLSIDGLSINSIQTTKNKTEIIYDLNF